MYKFTILVTSVYVAIWSPSVTIQTNTGKTRHAASNKFFLFDSLQLINLKINYPNKKISCNFYLRYHYFFVLHVLVNILQHLFGFTHLKEITKIINNGVEVAFSFRFSAYPEVLANTYLHLTNYLQKAFTSPQWHFFPLAVFPAPLSAELRQVDG